MSLRTVLLKDKNTGLYRCGFKLCHLVIYFMLMTQNIAKKSSHLTTYSRLTKSNAKLNGTCTLHTHKSHVFVPLT